MSVTLKNRLPQVIAELRPKVSEAVKESAEAVAESAKQRVPVESGQLRDAIHVERTGPAEYAVVGGDADAFYGHMVELGTVRTPARPFLIPAAEAELEATADRVAEAVKSL